MSNARRSASLLVPRLRAAVVVLAASLGLAACSSAIDMIPTQVGGLPSTAPARPETPPEYPNIYATPAPRESRPLSDDEQKKLEKELTDIRDRQAGTAKPVEAAAKAGAPKAGPAKPAPRREPVESTPKNRSP